MTQHTRTDLKELQKLDQKIVKAQQQVRDFDPLFEEVEEPALALESELNTTRSRLQEMKVEERRIELSTEEKRGRVKRLEDRLGSVRNLREEAAVSSELDMVKRSLQNEEQEALTLLDQIRKLEDRLAEVESAYSEAQAQVEPKKQDLLDRRRDAKQRLESMIEERESFASDLDPEELRLYEGIRSGGRRVAVADLTHDGACGNCFSVIPLQLQNEIRHGEAIIRCEGCGVILTAPEGPATQESPGE
jgi:predicted  nucleic acid-binding Zn-ribbon protein